PDSPEHGNPRVEAGMDFFKAFDNGILSWLRDHRTDLGNDLMVDITTLGGRVVLTLLVLFSVGLLIALRRYRTGCFVLLAVVTGSMLMYGVKELIGRDRPEIGTPLHHMPRSPSFPSGHSMISAVVYLTLALLVAGRLQGRRVRAFLIGSSLLLTFL